MDIESFRNSKAGQLVKTAGGCWAFVPNPLPPDLPWDDEVASLLSHASHSLGGLVGLGETLPNPHLLIYPFVRREAVLSSRIEGTQSSLSDLFLFEAAHIEKQRDVKEVKNYVLALDHGMKRLEKTELNLKLIQEIHEILMHGVWQGSAHPGEFRRVQNWIGPAGCSLLNATYVPPPVKEMTRALHDFENFLRSKEDMPTLVKISLLHYQFEAIHPFIDGNGRLGRLLIILYLHQVKLLPKPLLYISAFFEKYRREYYEHLLQVSQKALWQAWVKYFFRAIITQSEDALERARELVNLQTTYRKTVHEKQLSPSAGRVVDLIFQRPVININSAADVLKLTFPAVSKAMKQLEDIGLLRETTGQKRNMVYVAQEILDILEKE
ncbi:cell filamentation protein Fic [candidate division WOR_3 bacterium SM23_60]|uniref:Cell filamentation protein Fic n=1 Tax=candidate division WOR_3 bacterium SM23_60 TaxID=1703780 RepID=A0A0S8G636_UNCW3|nr:MAG: cell filamentation protein Fic [candidate division WOR_3 bacterium SM23_60]